MRMKSLLTALAVLAAVAALAGCASMRSGFSKYEGCDPDSNPAHVCRVAITVDSCNPDGSGIHADPLHRHIPPNGTWVIQWTLSTQGYEFADSNGIDVHGPDHVFTKRGRAGAATYVWVDHNTAHSDTPYKYKIHVLKNGAECASLDPDIYND